MEENKENIRNILQKASQPAIANDMAERVLSSWKAEQTALQVVPPLISKQAWIVICLGFAGLVYWILSNASASVPKTPIGDLVQGLDMSFSLDAFHIQPVMLLSVAALAVMIGINVLIMSGKWRTSNLSLF